MDQTLRFQPEDHYPPYNIVRTGEDSYRLSLAVAGRSPRLKQNPALGRELPWRGL